MGYRKDDGSWHDTCLDNLNHGEPFFVLRAQDKIAVTVVRVWAALASLFGSPKEWVAEAYAAAEEMEVWGEEHGTKVPD